ncbi:zinc-binding dehydrogenase [Alicyclobacillus fastidiosus]|uniref:Zinc-binding dehydrogenase n=1 Tax=Alicyclobacillus fastidiosus TaxID=392011 RepID=A0ABV5AA50_9BACL|nr:zinc-binding dehydrogenase [Alicyclobacillus fastidiosus]WEH07773.1 zinc-binding dehydrogenase [Alicyclobacillus fastidiosus]
MRQIQSLGADTVINLEQSDEQLIETCRKEAEEGWDVILDFLWGRATELLIRSLEPEKLSFAKKRMRLVQIGEKSGTTISLSADALRTTGLEIMGASAGIMSELRQQSSNQVWDWIRNGKLRMDIEQVALQDIEVAWGRTDFQGKRVVVDI